MLSVPTLWTVLVINFLALGLIWAYVQRTYPSFEASRYWTGSAFMCATSAAVAMLRGVYDDSLLPLLAAGTWQRRNRVRRSFRRPRSRHCRRFRA